MPVSPNSYFASHPRLPAPSLETLNYRLGFQLTVCTSSGGVLPMILVVPAYTAVMLWDPALRVDVP
jgi:hypothetical protein